MPDLIQLPFETAYAELQTIVNQLESGELPLEDSVALYERGRQLSAHCQGLLDQAELRVTQLTVDGRVEPL
jgi:exodeoxyribonuclease VII small subunit